MLIPRLVQLLEHIKLLAKLLNYFLRSYKSKIIICANQERNKEYQIWSVCVLWPNANWRKPNIPPKIDLYIFCTLCQGTPFHKTRWPWHLRTLEAEEQVHSCSDGNICKHERMRKQCKDCGGSIFCERQRRRSRCKDCGGNILCEHQRERSRCKDCASACLCKHQRRKSRCKDCGGYRDRRYRPLQSAAIFKNCFISPEVVYKPRYIMILKTFRCFVTNNKQVKLALRFCFPQSCSSAGRSLLAYRSRLDHYWDIGLFPQKRI